MKQPIKNSIKKKHNIKTVKLKKNIIKHSDYGTSKLEIKFKEQFLDILGVEYVYQFEAKDIGRFYDFYLPNQNLIIEVDGDYWHSNPNKYNKKDLNPTQKRNARVDEAKNKWALLHSIPIMRIWENDINNNPSLVMDSLKKRIIIENNEQLMKENKNKRH